MILTRFTSSSVFFFASIDDLLSLPLCMAFDTISSNIDEALSKVFLYYNFSQMTLLKWLTFLLASMTVAFTVLLLSIYLFFLMLVFLLQCLLLHWQILIMLLSQFPFTVCQIQKGMPCFIT